MPRLIPMVQVQIESTSLFTLLTKEEPYQKRLYLKKLGKVKKGKLNKRIIDGTPKLHPSLKILEEQQSAPQGICYTCIGPSFCRKSDFTHSETSVRQWKLNKSSKTNRCISHLQNLYSLGARRIGVTSLPPLGCLPAAITLFGAGSNDCVAHLNKDAINFNNKLGAAGDALKNAHPGLKLVVFDIYNPLLDLVKNPSNSGINFSLMN